MKCSLLLTLCVAINVFAPLVCAQEMLLPPRILLGPPELTPPPPTTGLVLDPPPAKPRHMFKNWCGEVEFGINGAEGNSQTGKLRAGGKAKHSTPCHILTFDAVYTLAEAQDRVTENRGISNIRQEWLLRESWSIFQTEFLEYDEFKAFDLRLALHTGLGYDWWKTDFFKFKTRLGAGGSWEFGGPDNTFKPEAMLGVDFDRKLTERQKICGSLDMFPDLTVFGQYRAVVNLNYELLIDPTWNLCLRLGVLDRYDSTSEGKKNNDMDYFATLLWKF